MPMVCVCVCCWLMFVGERSCACPYGAVPRTSSPRKSLVFSAVCCVRAAPQPSSRSSETACLLDASFRRADGPAARRGSATIQGGVHCFARAVEELNESQQIPSTDHAFESQEADDSVVTPASQEGIDEKCLLNNRSEARNVHRHSQREGGADQECAAIARLSLCMFCDRTCAT